MFYKFKYQSDNVRVLSKCRLTQEEVQAIIKLVKESLNARTIWYESSMRKIPREIYHLLEDDIKLQMVKTKQSISGKIIIKIIL